MVQDFSFTWWVLLHSLVEPFPPLAEGPDPLMAFVHLGVEFGVEAAFGEPPAKALRVEVDLGGLGGELGGPSVTTAGIEEGLEAVGGDGDAGAFEDLSAVGHKLTFRVFR